MVYEGEFVDQSSIYDKSIVMGKEDDGGQFKALWKPLEDFAGGKAASLPGWPVGALTGLGLSARFIK